MNPELQAAETLLDRGVSVPCRVIKVPFIKREIRLRLVMRRPYLGNQIRIARKYLEMGRTYEQILAFSKEEEMEFLVSHGKRISQMIALTICRGPVTGWLFMPLVAFVIRWLVPGEFILSANDHFVTLLGTKSFLTIIISAQRTNPLRRRMSHKEKGS